MTDYDSPWKNVLERYFPDFLAFFFPAAHAGIDWARGYTLLDKELQFPVASLTDYRAQWAELESSSNPFAVVTQAHLKAQETAGSDEARYREKLALVRSLYWRGYRRKDILELLRFIDWVLALPEGLENQLWMEVQQFEEEKRMRYVSSFERIAQKKGMEQGMERGMERGMEQGVGKGQARLLNRLIQHRFGALPVDLEARLHAATPEQLETWALRVLDAASLEDVFGPGGGH